MRPRFDTSRPRASADSSSGKVVIRLMMRFLRYRERSWRASDASGVMAGDLVLLLAFAFIGRWSHHELSAGALWGTLGTAAPFLIGWIVTAPVLGAYEPAPFRTYASAFSRLLAVWPVALVVA